ncbi:unnamed protein product, partial [Rotaria sp. Silwood1]
MTIASRYLDLFASTSEQSRLSGIFQLPIEFHSGNCCICINSNEKEVIVFDARSLGQYFAGDYWHPNVSFWIKSDLVDPR